MNLTKKQTKCLDFLEDNTTKEIIFGGGAGGGKSLLGCYWILKSCLKYPGTRHLIGRAKLKTLKETTFLTFLEVAKMQGLQNGIHFKVNNQSNVIYFFNGSSILMKDLFYYPSDPNFDELGSLEITYAFIDETAQISRKAWSIVKSRMRFKLDEFGLIPKILGSCNPNKGFSYAQFYKPSIDGTIEDSKKFIQSLVTDNPNISDHYIDNLNELDEYDRNRLLMGKWEYEEHEDQLISFQKAQDYFTNQYLEPDPKNKRLTVDVARQGSDSSIIRLWYGYVCMERIEMAKNSITQLADKIKDICKKEKINMSNVVADEDGVGGGLVDALRCMGFIANSKPIQLTRMKQDNRLDRKGSNYDNLKSQCTYIIADKIQKGELAERCNDNSLIERICEEMEWVRRRDADKDTTKKVITKDIVKRNINRSPDDWDSIMMLGYFELQRKAIFV